MTASKKKAEAKKPAAKKSAPKKAPVKAEAPKKAAKPKGGPKKVFKTISDVVSSPIVPEIIEIAGDVFLELPRMSSLLTAVLAILARGGQRVILHTKNEQMAHTLRRIGKEEIEVVID